MSKNLPLIALVALVALVGTALVYLKMQSNVAMTPSPMPTVEPVLTTPPAGVMNQETGTINQTAFEKAQKVSPDTTTTQIETELDQTVILEEDFSDL